MPSDSLTNGVIRVYQGADGFTRVTVSLTTFHSPASFATVMLIR